MGSQTVPTQTIVIWTLITSITATVSYYLYQKRRRQVESLPDSWRPVGFISKMFMYPLKSGHRMEVTEAECTARGLRQIHKQDGLYRMRDRGFLVYKDDDSEFRTARTYPQMLKIEVTAHDDTHIAIDATTMRTLYVKIPNGDEDKRLVKFWKDEKLPLIDCGDEAARWFSHYIFGKDAGLRLGYYYDDMKRDPAKFWTADFTFYPNLRNSSFGRLNDLSSILLINQASVDDLKQRMEDPTDHVSALNFRPNIIVDGSSLKPFEEDKWDFIKIGDEIVGRNVRDCTRCMMTTIDPDTAVRNKNREPLKTLEKYRMSNGPDKAPSMGIHLEILKPGNLKVGDCVYVNVTKQ